LGRSYPEKTHHKKRPGGVAQGVGPEFKPQYRKKKKIVAKPARRNGEPQTLYLRGSLLCFFFTSV
jgi:hypothetical protein